MTWDGKHKKQRLRCFACGMAAMNEAMDSMITKEGPTYDRWLAGMTRSLERAQAHRPGQPGGEPSVPNG